MNKPISFILIFLHISQILANSEDSNTDRHWACIKADCNACVDASDS